MSSPPASFVGAVSASGSESSRAHPRTSALPAWWPLAALTLLAAALRLSTLDLQSLWYDEAFTPVHTLHASLSATLRAVAHTENSPPLWYLLEWAITRVFGTGALALRALSALAGIACVPVGWGIGMQLTGRRATAIAAAGLIAVNPLFVWYSQEARAYGLFVLLAAVALLCFLRADAEPTPRRLAAFALAGSLALLTHYFAVFLLVGMCLLLILRHRERLRVTLSAVGAIGVVGLALLPLISAQGGHGTQWIGQWALWDRLQAIPQYYLTGYSGAPLGHGIELLVALPLLAGVGLGLWRVLIAREERAALTVLLITACGVLIPIALVAVGVDYLAPRNLVAAMIPLTALIAVVVVSTRAGRAGVALAVLIAAAFLAISVDVDLSPRLQRGNWRDLSRSLRPAASAHAITTVELGSAPLEYYLPPLRSLPRGDTITVSEIDETGYLPLRASAGSPPAPGFQLLSRLDIDGLIVYRFVSPVPRAVSEAVLRRSVITPQSHSEVLVPVSLPVSTARAQVSTRRA